MELDFDEPLTYQGKKEYQDSETPILPSSERRVMEPKFPSMLLKALDAARRQGRYTDLVLTTPRGEFHVHRLVMASVSRTVAEDTKSDQHYLLLTHNGPAKRTSHVALAAVIEFVYSGKTRLDVENVEGVLSLAVHFQISYLIQVCQEFIVEHMSESTIIKFLDFCAGYPLDVIKEKLFRYLHDNIRYLMTEKNSRLMFVSVPAIAEFLRHNEAGMERSAGDEAKLELVIRYIFANDQMDKKDELDLVTATKTLISGMSDKGLGRCLTKIPKLLFKDNVRHFLRLTGICLKNMSTQEGVDGELRSPQNGASYKQRDVTNNQQSRNTPFACGSETSCVNDSECSDLKTTPPLHRNITQNKSPSRSPYSYITMNDTPGEQDMKLTKYETNFYRNERRSFRNETTKVHQKSERRNDPNLVYKDKKSCRVFQVGSRDEKASVRDKQTATSSAVRQYDSSYMTEIPVMNLAKPVSRAKKSTTSRPERSLSKPVETTSRRCPREPAVSSPRVSLSSSEETDQPWSDSPRFANGEYELYPDLSPRPDLRARLGEIALFYQLLPDNRAAIGGIRMTYIHRRAQLSYSCVKEVGVVPTHARKYDVIKLKENQWIRGVGLGVSDIVHWICFYTCDKRMFGPFGHEGGQSVRVEAPSHKPELYSVHCATRQHGEVDVLSNILFRWIRPP